MFRKFKRIEEITNYIVSPYDIPIYEVANKDLGTYVLPLFASELTDIPENMMMALTLYSIETGANMKDAVIPIFEKLYDTDLSIYKFCVLCGMRGPLNLDTLKLFVTERYTVDNIAIVAKHPKFPSELRQFFYERTGDVEYLPKDAQDIFVF